MMKNPIVAFGGGALLAMLAMYVAMRPSEPAAAPAVKEVVVAQVEEPKRVELRPVDEPVAPAPAPMPARSFAPRDPAPRNTEKPAPQRTTRANNAQVSPAPASREMARVEASPMPAAQPSAGAAVAAAAIFGNGEPSSKPVAAKPESAPAVTPAPKPREPQSVTLREGTVLTIRTAELLSSERQQAGDTFTAALAEPLVVDGFVLAERGARVSGRVVEAAQAGKVRGTSRLSLELTQVTLSDGQKVALATDPFLREGESSKKSDAAKVGAGAAIGAALGGIFGGGKGAAIGGAAGAGAGGGAVVLTRGKPVEIASESRLPFRLTRNLTITEKL